MQLMNDFYTMLKFSVWAIEAPIFLPPLMFASALAVIGLFWATIKQQPFRTHRWRPHHWFVFGHLLFFVAAIAIGVFGAHPSPTLPPLRTPPISAAEHALAVVWYGSIASCVFWVWTMKGFRWFAASLMLLTETVVFGALFIAGMAVSGDWL
jgi:hypothetical protein